VQPVESPHLLTFGCGLARFVPLVQFVNGVHGHDQDLVDLACDGIVDVFEVLSCTSYSWYVLIKRDNLCFLNGLSGDNANVSQEVV
jgi:hypothetical protein